MRPITFSIQRGVFVVPKKMSTNLAKTVLLISLIPSLAVAGPKHQATPTPTPDPKGVIVKQGFVCRTKQQDLELRDWIAGLMNQVHEAQADNDAAQASNSKLQWELAASQKAATDLANECAKDKACAKAPLSCWFHRLLKHILWIGGGIVVLVIALCVASIFVPALAPILSFFVSIWKWLLGLLTRKPPAP